MRPGFLEHFAIKNISFCGMLFCALCVCLCGCQFPWLRKGDDIHKTTGTPKNNPCVVLALPASGPYAPIAAKIKRGAEAAGRQLKTEGLVARLENINTEDPAWLTRLEALPPMCAVVGGPIQDKHYVEARKAGALERRIFFSFMPTLQSGDEGKLAWRFFPSPQDQIDALIRFATDELNIRSYGAFYPTDNYGQRMCQLLEQTLGKKHMTLHKAAYNPGAPATWIEALAPLIKPTTLENSKTPVPQTEFEAIFLPDSWKHMDMLTTSLMYNGEDRLALLGTAIWEPSLAGKQVLKPEKYALAVFPGAWDKTRAPKQLQAPGNDFWSALGYDFMNFAVKTGLDSRVSASQVASGAQKAAGALRAMAPMTWNGGGVASQRLYLFQIGPAGIRPLDVASYRQTRSAILERAALRMQGLPNEADVNAETMTGVAQPARVDAPAANQAASPAAPRPAVQQGQAPALSPTPQPSYKLRLPARR